MQQETWLTKEDVLAVVRTHVIEVLGDVAPEQVTPDKSLTELGANSVDRLEVTTLSMASLSLQIPLMSFANVQNIGGLVDVLHSHLH